MKATFDNAGPVILSIDDSEQVLRLRAALLQMSGYQVLSANGAALAREVLRANRVDAIITDSDMPGESGLAFARWVRACGYTMPIVMCSGSIDCSQQQDIISEFISKGEPTSLLLSRLSTHLLSRTPRSVESAFSKRAAA